MIAVSEQDLVHKNNIRFARYVFREECTLHSWNGLVGEVRETQLSK